MATLFRCPPYEGCDVTMALPKGRSVAAAGCAAITGAGVALGFTVLDSTTSTWLLILATAIPLGVSPVVAGWLSPELKQAWFFPTGVLASLSVATAIYGPLSSDSEPIGFVVMLTLIYGGVSPVVAGWLSPELKQAWFFPTGVLASLSVATAIYGPLSSDSEPIGFVVMLTLIYGGGASVAFCVAWIARQYLRRLRGHRMPVSHLAIASLVAVC